MHLINCLKQKFSAALFLWNALLLPAFAFSQPANSITIDSCYAWARKNYPLLHQSDLINQSRDFTIENIARGNLPQVSFAGQATYQSEVTQFPIKLPNVQVPTLSKDQYKLYGEISQSLTDKYNIGIQKEIANASAESRQQSLETELYKIKDRINQLYFGVLLADEQIKQTALLKKDISNTLSKINAAISNGTAFKSNAQTLQAELYKTDQRNIELVANRKAFTDMLSWFTGITINESTVFSLPVSELKTDSITRPELKQFSLAQKEIDLQQKLVDNKKLPRVNLFAQAGIGRPALNFLSNDLKGYYITGVRMQWNITSFYTIKKERALLDISRQNIGLQQQTFLFNTRIVQLQQNSEIRKYQQLIATDNEIVSLRQKVKQTAQAQLENGVITTLDYLSYLNAEDQAMQARSLHTIQLLLAETNLNTTIGN